MKKITLIDIKKEHRKRSQKLIQERCKEAQATQNTVRFLCLQGAQRNMSSSHHLKKRGDHGLIYPLLSLSTPVVTLGVAPQSSPLHQALDGAAVPVPGVAVIAGLIEETLPVATEWPANVVLVWSATDAEEA